MDVNSVYQIVLYAAAKNLQQGYVSPDDFNNVLMPTAQNGYLDYLLGEYQKYTPTRPFAPVEFAANERIRTSMATLIYGACLQVPLQEDCYNVYSAISPYPDDFVYVDAMWTQYGYSRVKFIQQDRLDKFIHSTIDPIATNPVYLLRADGFQFFPADIAWVKMSYVREPPPITWGYTLDVNGLPVYNAALSHQPIWGETDMMNIIVRALSLVGINLQLGTVSQYAEVIKQGGQ